MKFKLTCSQCEHVMDLEGTIHVDRFKCEKCGGDIELREGRMEEGVRIAGKYQTLFKTNDDGYSSSFICKDLNDDDLHLLRIYDKTLTKLISKPEDFVEIIGAVSFMAGSNHMPIIDTGISQQYMYQVMPFRKLESLEQLIEFGYVWEAPQALDLIYELVISLEEGVKKIGTGHFNLNPNNIFISNKGKVRYQGFGLAPQLLLEKQFVDSDFQVFDIYYMSPELAKGTHYPTESSDVYSLGMVLYYMMTGLTPLTTDSDEVINYESLKFPMVMQQKLDNHFLALFAKMTAVDSEHRIQSIRELKQSIEHYFSTFNHESLAQMEGEKTDLYKQDLYKQKVTDLLKPFVARELKAVPSTSEEVVRKRMATQTSIDIQLDLSEKLHNPKRVRRRRLKANTNPKRLAKGQARKRVHKQESKSNQLFILVGCLLLGMILTVVVLVLSSSEEKKKPQIAESVEEVEIDLKEDVETKVESKKTPKEEKTKKRFSVDIRKYELELRKAEIDFAMLDETLANDRKEVSLKKHTILLDKYAKRIELAKKDAQRRILIDLKSEAGALVFNKKFDEAKALYLEYDGIFAEETAEQRKQLASEVEVRNKNLLVQEEIAEVKIENINKINLDEKVELIAEYLLTDELLLANVNSKTLLELDNSPAIKRFVDMIAQSSKEPLQEMVLTNLAKDDEGILEVEFNNKLFKAEVQSCDLDEARVKLLIDVGNGKLIREYPLSELPSKSLSAWVLDDDPSKQAFFRAMFYVHRDQLLEASKIIQTYEGLYSSQFKDEFNKRLSLQANVMLEELFKTFNYPYLERTEKTLATDDLVALDHMMSNILREYDGLVDFNGGRDLYQKLQEKLRKQIPNTNTLQIFVGPSNSTKYKLEDMASKSKVILRLLPGEYDDDLKITGKKLNIIGTKEVVINGNVIVAEDGVSLKNLHIQGDVVMSEGTSDLNIENCLIHGAILLREDADKLEVNNTILNGIGGKEADKVIVNKSLLRKPLHNLKAVVNGMAEWEFTNCIILSNEQLINFPQKGKRGDYSYCLLYTTKAVGSKKNENFYSLKEADGQLGDFDNCQFIKPKFKDAKAGDYRLLEFTPGYQEGYKNDSIGVRMNEDLDLR